MRIERITTAVVEANYDWTIVRIESDEGVCGRGEAFCAPGLTQTVRELSSLLEGEDARQVEPLVRKLHLATAHVSAAAPCTTRSRESRRRSGIWRRARSMCRSGSSSAAASATGCASTPTATPARPDQLQPDPRLAAAAWMEIPGDTLHDAAPEVHWAPAETAEVYTPDGPGIGAELDLDACRRFARPEEPFFDEPGPS